MLKDPTRRGAESYTRTVDLGGNKQCSLKRHFRGIFHEVIGYLDLQAKRHPETRFVYCGVDDIVAHCTKFKSKESYKKRAVVYVLTILRERHIISPRLRRHCDGQMRDGFIVAPHEHVTKQKGSTKCVFVGMAGAFDCWHQLPTGEIFWVNPNDLNRHKKLEYGDYGTAKEDTE